MIITCEKCSKKFNIQDHLIPSEGRLLQCGSCSHKWFFKNPKTEIVSKNEEIIKETNEEKIVEKDIDVATEDIKNDEKKDIKSINKTTKKPKIIKNTLVFIISIIALIILVDTFKNQLENYLPGINSILNNLYESLEDLSLFFKDLIN